MTALYNLCLGCFHLTCSSVYLCKSLNYLGRDDPTGRGRNYVELEVMVTPRPFGLQKPRKVNVVGRIKV